MSENLEYPKNLNTGSNVYAYGCSVQGSKTSETQTEEAQERHTNASSWLAMS